MSQALSHADLLLKIEHRLIAELRPLGRQAKRHPKKQIEGVAKSIAKLGFLNPLLIDEDGQVLAGNARIEAAKLLGYVTVPVIVAEHLTVEEKRVYVLAENRLSELGEWDKATLGAELRELATLDLGFSLDITGFDTLEIEALSFGGDEADDEPRFTVPRISTNQSGDLWVLGDHRLLCGNATEAASYDLLLGGEKVRAVWVDPPFNVPVAGHVTSRDHREFLNASGEMSDEEFIEFLLKALRQFARVLVGGGLAYVCMDWRHIRHVLEAAERTSLTLQNIAIWDKVAAGQGGFLRSQHEMIPIFKNGSGRMTNNVQLGRNGRNRSNVWAYEHSSAHMRAERDDVPTPKPVKLVQDALLDSTSKGDLIVDALAGGGSAAIAAERIGRCARLIELDPIYCDVIVRRWQASTGREATLAGSGETFRAVGFRRERERSVASASSIPAFAPARTRHRTGRKG